jgi:3D-(3,5/4)-trihydroxycyclohexane-1,2-dione acylhydrolase (decyclizing)
MTIAEAVAAFLVENGVRYAFGIGGHGNTPLLEAFLPYHRTGRLRVVDVQHEAIAAHAAVALKWACGIESVVFTSIGPGWLNTLIGQNTAMSNGYGFLILAGDKTTAYEGPNMQQIMPDGQFGFVHTAEAISKKAYTVIDPRNVYTIMREALAKTREPGNSGTVNVFLPMNLQAATHDYNLDLLLRPLRGVSHGLRPDPSQVKLAAEAIRRHRKIVLRVGGGAVGAGDEIKALASHIGAAIVMGPIAMDVVESDFPLNVGPAGSKGSICGNLASENATLVLNIGGRGVCQSDCSATLYASASEFININLNAGDALRYDGIPLVGDARVVMRDLLAELPQPQADKEWLHAIAQAKKRWAEYLEDYYRHPLVGGKLTQPAVLKTVDDFINSSGGLKIYDAGDVQAHGFQIARHLGPKTFFSETGNSAMGFAICASFGLGLIEGGRYPTAIVGDGSFLMQAQAIRDMAKHGARCTVVVLDNQAMSAIAGLQWAQNYQGFATSDPPGLAAVDFAALAECMGAAGFRAAADLDSVVDCLDGARRHNGPAVVDVKVAFGPEKYTTLGAFGRWNVGPWSEAVEAIWEGIGSE